MKTLKLSELKEGVIYWCNLSNRKVLVFMDDDKDLDATVYNPVIGVLEPTTVYNNQLSELTE